jgi:acetyl esterase
VFNALKVWLLRWLYRFMNRRAWKGVDLAAAQTRDFMVAETIPSREYRAGDSKFFIYYHGGGWTIGDLDSHDPFCRRLAVENHATVVALDYRLGPKSRFPAAVEDCLAGTEWLLAQQAELGLGGAPVFIAGDSAGGNLAAVVANQLDARDRIDGQILIYPAVRHCTPPNRSYIENGKGHVLTYGLMVWFWRNYLGEKRITETGDIDPRATPLYHPLPDRVPAALVITAGLDPLRDEGAEYAQKLADHGVDCVHELFMKEEHGFVCSEGLTEGHNRSMELIAAWTEAQKISR